MVRLQIEQAFSARIVGRKRMLYREGASRALDRPPHVRAASGVSWLGDKLAVVQDDAHFIALVDPHTGLADAIPLPADAQGRRLFDDTRGTKHLKLDLETCFVVTQEGQRALIALGSGSKPLRERIVVLRQDAQSERITSLRTIDAHALYASLHQATEFSGSELNIEGAVLHEGELLLFQRGNGAPSEGRPAVNAIAALSWPAFERYLDHDGRTEVPALLRVQQYDLGRIADVPYTFTDATLTPRSTVMFLASAEDSSSAITDGTVHGTLIGELAHDGTVRAAPLLDERGSAGRIKAEGLALDPHDAKHGWIVVDMDDPTLASELLEVRLGF